jgi:hypothetical protein
MPKTPDEHRRQDPAPTAGRQCDFIADDGCRHRNDVHHRGDAGITEMSAHPAGGEGKKATIQARANGSRHGIAERVSGGGADGEHPAPGGDRKQRCEMKRLGALVRRRNALRARRTRAAASAAQRSE